ETLLPLAFDDARPDAVRRFPADPRIPRDDARGTANDGHRCDGKFAKIRSDPLSARPRHDPRPRSAARARLRMLRDLEARIRSAGWRHRGGAEDRKKPRLD